MPSNCRLLWLLLLSLLRPQSGIAEGDCNVCSVTNDLACVSETQFKVCLNDIPSGNAYDCPAYHICSTANATICQPRQSGAIVSCSDCNTCNEGRTFACTGVTTFALCLGAIYPSNITGDCAPNYVCNVGFEQICGSESLGVAPTCPTSSGTTTPAPTSTPTASPSTSPVAFCQTVRRTGRYPVGTDLNSTCRQYIYCYSYGFVWTGALYTCPGRTYFNSWSQMCTISPPRYCTCAVKSLSLSIN